MSWAALVRALGTRSRSACALLAWSLLAWGLLAGCLVTDKVDYTVANTPPTITSITPSALTRIPETPPLACSPRLGIELKVDVRDPDLDDKIQVRVLVNGQLFPGVGNSISASGAPARQTLTLCVPSSARFFANACNLLEVLVSSGFVEGSDFAATEIPGDLARAQLLVLASVSDEPGASSEDCLALLSQLEQQSQSDAGEVP